MSKGAKTAAGIAVVVGLGLAGWVTYKHFSKGTAPANLAPSGGNASKPAGSNATGPASVAIAGIQTLPSLLGSLDNVFSSGGGSK
jgi:hypothetical protein